MRSAPLSAEAALNASAAADFELLGCSAARAAAGQSDIAAITSLTARQSALRARAVG